jgi:hypothetical protein
MGYLRSEWNRRRMSASAGYIISRLTSRSITGHSLPPHVHQHYGLEFHIVLKGDSCIRRDSWSATTTHQVCRQLERGLEGVCSCIFDDESRRVFSMSDKVEPCLRAHPLFSYFRSPCSCAFCDPNSFLYPLRRWVRKIKQLRYTRRDICCCRGNHSEQMDRS